MIPIDFEYYRPSTIIKAVQLYQDLTGNQKQTIFYGGGTEIISRARMNEISPNAVIDLKNIPECNVLKKDTETITIGATVSLTQIADSAVFPLLTNVARSIAFRTARNKITIGGNLTGDIIYREALLPFLLTESEAVIAGREGTRQVVISGNGIKLNEGEFIVQLVTNNKFAQYRHINHKTTKQSKVNYPIVSIASILVDDQIRVAFSGVCAYPFRLNQIEEALNDVTNSPGKRIQAAIDLLPAPILHDAQASSEYREFVLKQALQQLLDNFEGVS
ncbi:FAD binding domain-containing protein [Virgibacillus oceani]|uniref:Xanthine dehydrogenase n=1 Tax=Virgibacillus oceani TaxID=1479511 RepID=A0A917M1T3_9BACI|nr:FAD binding domain-containing protein [Virgibacillus oceani]GGG73897.1 xanthine dehydrogenase [Virgibacillus oceani]